MSEQPSPLAPLTRESLTWLSRWDTTKPLQIWVRTLLSWVVALMFGAVLFIVPMPYVVESPGLTFDMGGSYRGEEMFSVSDVDPSNGGALHVDATHEKGDGNGELGMVIASEQGGPDRRLNLMRPINTSLSETSQLIPYPTAYPDGMTMDQIDAAQSWTVKSSQSSIDIAVLEMLGQTMSTTTTIRGTAKGSDAVEKVRDGDILLSIIDEAGAVHPVDSVSMVFRLVKRTPAGSALVLRVMCDGEQVELGVETIPDESHPRDSRLGICLDMAPRFPLDVQVNLESVGSPPAEFVFLFTIIDKFTPRDLTGGHVIVVTGTASYDGEAGPTGGTIQKMYGTRRGSGEWFLTPALNCDEVVGNVPEGLSVVAVTALGKACEAVEAIATGQTEEFTDCENVAGAS